MDGRAREADVRRPTSARALLLADLQRTVPGRPGARWWVEVALRVLLVPRVRALCLFRLSQVARRLHLQPLALLLQARTLRGSGAELSPSATIGAGMTLMHSAGVVVGPEVRIGAGVRIYQGVTLGDGRLPGQPVLGDDVTIGAGASVLGPVHVGDRVIIGAGACVTRDLPDDTVAMATSATFKSRRPGADVRLDELMAQDQRPLPDQRSR